MTVRSKQILSLLASSVLLFRSASFAQIQPSRTTLVAPMAASAQTAVPPLVPFSGVAVDREGRALDSETGITFLLFKDQTGGEPLLTETQRVVPDATGHYTVRLGATMSSGVPLDLFSSGEVRWLEVQITGQPIQPRILFTSVPYALKAADAATLGGLPASAFMLASSTAAVTPTRYSFAPDAASNVTTPGGTNLYLPKFNAASTVINSQIYDNGTSVGIGDVPNPSARLDINGAMIMRGNMTVSRTGNATSSKAYPSYGFDFFSNAYNSSTKATENPYFQLQSEPKGNNTASPSATFNLLFSNNGSAPAETGLSINPNGTINFAPAQILPGGTGTGSAVCIATGGGFGNGGTTFVAPAFTVPAGGGCAAWSGFTKTATTVVLFTTGAGCVSSDAMKLTLSVSSADPNYLGAGTMASDYIQLTRTSTTGSFTSGSDQGEFSGNAAQVSCTSDLLQLNESND
jgi:hypothetical protein